VRLEHLVDGHYFNLIRGDARNPGLKDVRKATLSELYRGIADIQYRYALRLINDRNPLIRWIKRIAYVGTLTFHHRTQLENLEERTEWKMPCTAGETSAVVDFDGRILAQADPGPGEKIVVAPIDLAALRAERRRRSGHHLLSHLRTEAYTGLYDRPIYPPGGRG
jgi:hypothetical protein